MAAQLDGEEAGDGEKQIEVDPAMLKETVKVNLFWTR